MARARRSAKERIANAATALLERGRPSVEEIAAAAGVSRATFYRAYRSREALLRHLDVEPDPAARERVLEAALPLLATSGGLAALSMDGLADAAGVSRATVYRLFPGKAALFEAVVRAYSPLEPIRRTLQERAAEPPEVVIPVLARTVAETMEPRLGIIAPLFFQAIGGEPEGEATREWVLGSVLREVVGYIAGAMAAGRLRPANPLLALQSLMGPIFFHLVTRRPVEARLGPQPPVAEVAEEMSRTWLRAMLPAKEDAS